MCSQELKILNLICVFVFGCQESVNGRKVVI